MGEGSTPPEKTPDQPTPVPPEAPNEPNPPDGLSSKARAMIEQAERDKAMSGMSPTMRASLERAALEAADRARAGRAGQAQGPPGAPPPGQRVPAPSPEQVRSFLFNRPCPTCRRLIGAHLPGEIHLCVTTLYVGNAWGKSSCPMCSESQPHEPGALLRCMSELFVIVAAKDVLADHMENVWRT